MKTKLTLAAVAAFFLVSCATSHINPKRINAAAFPADFTNPNHILLVEKWTKGMSKGTFNRKVERSFQKSYTGKFEMVTREQIESYPKYADKSKYRYVLSNEIWSSRSKTVTTTVTSAGPTSHSVQYNNAYRLDFHLYDRAEDKNYPDIGVSSNSFPKAIKRLSSVMNKKYTGKI